MPRIQWDATGERTFETGVDRGMLYVFPFPGTAWNGIVRISETPSGVTSGEFYADGRKYLGVTRSGEYSSDIEAFFSPSEFSYCRGRIRLSPGLFADGQPRRKFGFSYRTLTGDDIQGTSSGYKLHVVYNALLRASDSTQETTGDLPNVKPYSWTITTVPESVTGSRPSSHFVVDSRKTDPGIINDIEDVLYGTESADPRLPSVQELLTLAGS